MLLTIVAAILVLAIAFYQVVQGLFSALVMTVLTVLCAALSFAVYPLVAELLYTTQPSCADALALIATFALPLLALRMLADRFIPGNVVLGVWADRIAGGILGIFTGIVVIGMLTIAVQLLPFGESVLTYKPFNSSLQRSSALVPFYCDEFVIGVVNKLSAGSLSSGSPLEEVHEDLLLDAQCSRNTAGKYGRVDALPDALKGVEFYNAPELRMATWRNEIPANPMIKEGALEKDLVVRCHVDASARDESGRGDTKQRWRLPGTHFRLVTKTGQSHYPMAYLTYEQGVKGGWAVHTAPLSEASEGAPRQAELAKLVVVRPASKEMKSLAVDWVFRIPADQDPGYVVFRRVSRRAPSSEQDYTDDDTGGRMPPGLNALDREGLYDEKKKRRRRG